MYHSLLYVRSNKVHCKHILAHHVLKIIPHAQEAGKDIRVDYLI